MTSVSSFAMPLTFFHPLAVVEWALVIFGAFGMGLSKAGFPGIGLLHVVIFAFLFGARESTGIVLPMLLVGDAYAVVTFRKHARWEHLRRMLPPALLGVAIGAAFMSRLSDAAYKPLIGWIILTLTLLQAVHQIWPDGFGRVPRSVPFAWGMGLLAGATTMLANAAGSIMALYALAIRLPKYELVGTNAWFFLSVNAFKVPFSAQLGLIRAETLWLNVALLPAILLGLVAGRWLIRRVPQRLFDILLLTFAGAAAIRLILS
jgi:uncharacterized membrane protein YfcA